MAHIEVSTVVGAARSEVFDFVCDPISLPELLADHIEVMVESPSVTLKKGAEFQFLMTRFGMSQRVRLRIEDYVRGSRLAYTQVDGLFQNWLHIVLFEEISAQETRVTDLVDYRLPMGLLGNLADDLYVKSDMQGILSARLERVRKHYEI